MCRPPTALRQDLLSEWLQESSVPSASSGGPVPPAGSLAFWLCAYQLCGAGVLFICEAE